MSEYVPELYWDSTYAIVLALMEHHPNRQPEDIGLHELGELVTSLPGFKDNPAIATERILLDIQNTWYEEATTL